MPENGRLHPVLMYVPVRHDSGAIPGLQHANGSAGHFALRPRLGAPDIPGGSSSPAPIATSDVLVLGQPSVTVGALGERG
jgi:hypothetical protein